MPAMPLPTRPLRAVIFDMDGTLVDSERVIMHAWLSAAQQAGRPIDPEFYVKVIGLNVEESDRVLLDHLGSTVLLETIRQTVTRQLAARDESIIFPLKPGAAELLDTLRSAGIPCAVASSSSVQEIKERLTRVRVLEFFETIAGGDEVCRGKPDPAVYRLAAARLGIPPEQCLVFEDSAHGAASASAAGAEVVLVPDMRKPEPALLESVSLVLDSLANAIPVVSTWFGQRAENHADT